jgi:AcrR family transcriptional regulator
VTQYSKPKRQYYSNRRQAQENETRKQIIDAANKLFSLQGYAEDTVDFIGQEAGIPQETIYAVFGKKRTILTNLIDLSVGGDKLLIPLLQRSGLEVVLQENDPVRVQNLFARFIAGRIRWCQGYREYLDYHKPGDI